MFENNVTKLEGRLFAFDKLFAIIFNLSSIMWTTFKRLLPVDQHSKAISSSQIAVEVISSQIYRSQLISSNLSFWNISFDYRIILFFYLLTHRHSSFFCSNTFFFFCSTKLQSCFNFFAINSTPYLILFRRSQQIFESIYYASRQTSHREREIERDREKKEVRRKKAWRRKNSDCCRINH